MQVLPSKERNHRNEVSHEARTAGCSDCRSADLDTRAGECFGATALIQRCQEHKRRNVIEHLPEALHDSINRSLRDAWSGPGPTLAKKQLLRLALSLETQHPGAAASLKEGLDETLTVQGLGITGALYRTLRTTSPIENLNGSIAHYTRNVKRWKDGQMVLRWVASAFSDAAGRFRKLKGYSDMKSLLDALDQRAPLDLADNELKAA
jgi:putative transposase